MNVLQATTDPSITCMYSLNLDFIFLKVDPATYNKCLQILFSHKENSNKNYDNVMVHMGGFQVLICMLRAVYSGLKDSGTF